MILVNTSVYICVVCHFAWDVLHNVVPDNNLSLSIKTSEDVIHNTANNSFSVLKIHDRVRCVR